MRGTDFSSREGKSDVPSFDSFAHNPSETRRTLRSRFSRNLSTWDDHSSVSVDSTPDEAVLKLLLNLRIEFNSAPMAAGRIYNKERQQHVGAPRFKELHRLGCVRLIWGRLKAPLGGVSPNAGKHPDLGAAITPFFRRLLLRRFEVERPEALDSVLGPVIEEMRTSPEKVHHLPCATPEWIAARLWERAPQGLSSGRRLRFWADRCSLLPPHEVAPSLVWPRRVADEFRNSAFEALECSGFFSWTDLRDHLAAKAATESGQSVDEITRYIPPIPATVVGRYLWFRQLRSQDHLDTCSDLWGLVNCLLAEVEQTSVSAAPHELVRRLLDVAVERPELLDFIVLRAGNMPRLLADLALDPRTSALACLLIVQWNGTGGLDRAVMEAFDRAGQDRALEDAFSILCQLVSRDHASAEEFADLFSWLLSQSRNHSSYRGVPSISDRLVQSLRAEVERLPEEVLREAAIACVNRKGDGTPGPGNPGFDAALAMISCGAIEESFPPKDVVTAYVEGLRGGSHYLSARGISAEDAKTLVRLALRSDPSDQNEFLSPVNIKAKLKEAEERGANPYTATDEIARSLRVHIRLLSRAVAAWEDTPPEKVVDALVVAVRKGALSHAEKGRVAAFSAKYEAEPHAGNETRPIAADLASALKALLEKSRDGLLQTALETDEPAMLAQLLRLAPRDLREQISARIDKLTPAEAGTALSLTEIHTRIEHLIEAGATEAARRFITFERGLQTLGPVSWRDLTRLRFDLQVNLQKKNFDEILRATAPPNLAKGELKEAEDTIMFFQSLAELSRPQGNLQRAEKNFALLAKKNSHIPAYGVNLLAVQVARLLGDNLFGTLQGEARSRARQLLAEGEERVNQWLAADPKSQTIHESNASLLLMALGQPERARQRLAALDPSDDHRAAYLAVALHRTGDGDGASATLSAAENQFGATDVLQAARAQIERGAPFEAKPEAVRSDDRMNQIKGALADFSRLPAVRQAEILHPLSGSLGDYLLDQVRGAAGRVTALVPMMKDVKVDSCEDDLTAVVQAVLASRLKFLGWSVSDQSKGGFTAKGNPGERDLILEQGDSLLSVLEAVVCNRPVSQQWVKDELKSHFQKLFAYAKCPLFFYLVYSYTENPAAVVAQLKSIAQSDAPSGFIFERVEEHAPTDSRPTGFSAFYSGNLGRSPGGLSRARHATASTARCGGLGCPNQSSTDTPKEQDRKGRPMTGQRIAHCFPPSYFDDPSRRHSGNRERDERGSQPGADAELEVRAE